MQHGIEVAGFYCIACSDANSQEKEKKDPHTFLLMVHGNKAELMLHHINIEPFI